MLLAALSVLWVVNGHSTKLSASLNGTQNLTELRVMCATAAHPCPASGVLLQIVETVVLKVGDHERPKSRTLIEL